MFQMLEWYKLAQVLNNAISASPTARPYPRNRHAVGDAMAYIGMAYIVMATGKTEAHVPDAGMVQARTGPQ